MDTDLVNRHHIHNTVSKKWRLISNGRIMIHLIVYLLLSLPAFGTAKLNESSVKKMGGISPESSTPKPHFTSSNLPIVVIDTHGETIQDPIRIVVDMGIIYNGIGKRNYLSDSFNNYDGKINIEIRGSTSRFFPKKQYALETQNSDGSNRNISLLGLPAENDWILHAPYSDKSLIRNVLAYKFSNDIGRYASRTRFCELVLNGDYRGVYILMEKIKRDKNRVDIAKLNADEISGDDLTGGYILKIDKTDGENVGGWYSPVLPYQNAWQKIYYQYHYPKPDEIVTEQKNYIRNFIDDFENTMLRDDYAEPQSGYSRFIDTNSFADYLILSEFTKNVDAYRLSMFMYKDKTSKYDKFVLGPIWDFNLAFGNCEYYDSALAPGWHIDFLSTNHDFLANDNFLVPFWWPKLTADPSFRAVIFRQWNKIRNEILKPDYILNTIDSLTTYLDEAQIRNFERWPILGDYVWPNIFIGQTYQEEIEYLKQWTLNRLQWLDENFPAYCYVGKNHHSLPYPRIFSIKQNFPNPFNIYTSIQYHLFTEAAVEFNILNLRGQTIRHFQIGSQSPGEYSLRWDGKDNAENFIPSGTYFYQIRVLTETGAFVQIKKLVLLK